MIQLSLLDILEREEWMRKTCHHCGMVFYPLAPDARNTLMVEDGEILVRKWFCSEKCVDRFIDEEEEP